jgi:hypothetical protein
VETDFEAFLVECCEDPVDPDGAPAPSSGVEESGLDEPLGDSFFHSEQFLAGK